MKRALPTLVLMLAFLALAQSSYSPSNGLLFGNGTLYTGATKPTNGQAVCNNGGVLGPCGGSVSSTIVSGTTVNVTSDGTSSIQLEYLILANNVTTINTPSAASMPDGKIIYLAIMQPVGNFNYTIPACFTAAPGTQVYVTNGVIGGTQGYCGGTGVLPGMPNATYAELDFALHYRSTQPAGGVPTLRVQSATQ